MSRSFRLGLFMLTTLAILAACVFLVGRQESEFGSNYLVRSEFENVAGLSEALTFAWAVSARERCDPSDFPRPPTARLWSRWIWPKKRRRSSSRTRLPRFNPRAFWETSMSKSLSARWKRRGSKGGETIDSQPPFDISDLFQKANQMLDTGEEALDNIDQITAKINTGQGTAGKLINDTTLYKQAAAGVTSLHEDADALQHNFLLRGFFKNQGYSNPAEITQHEVPDLPKQAGIKNFDYNPKDLFDKPDAAKLKNEKNLDAAGQFLQSQKFGLAVVVVTTGRKGDSDKDRVLSEARAFVVRKYLVENFQLDDTRVKTLGLGKTADATPDGSIVIRIYASSPTAEARKIPARD